MRAYLPYPYSYAGAVYYNPANGVWARGGAVYGPYGAAKAGAAYNPATGAYARGGAVYGPNGGAGAFSAYNPSTGSYARGSASWNANGGSANANFYNANTGVSGATTQNANMYQRWGSTTINTPTQTVTTQSASGPRGSAGTASSSTGAQGAAYNTARGQGAAVQTSSGDVYAGRDGNAYKHTSDGWSTWNNGSWQSVQPPSGASASVSPAVNRPTQTGPTQTGPTTRPTQAPATRPATTQAARPAATFDRSNYQQLEQDRFARTAGQRPAPSFTGAPAGHRFGR